MQWMKSIIVLTAATTILAGCSSSSSGGGGDGKSSNAPGGGPSSSGGSGAPSINLGDQPDSKIKKAELTGDCADFGVYGKYSGAKVSIYTSITNPELAFYVDSLKKFEQCTGIAVEFQGTKDFETALRTKVEGNNAPDIALFPQPGLLAKFASDGTLKGASKAVTEEAQKNWDPSFWGYGVVDGLFFGAPLSSNMKSLVWYSPKSFKKNGYQVPKTWDDLIALSNKMVKDGNKPWCLGVESGEATGWPLTDWLEDVMLRMYGRDVYEQWTAHKIPFNDERVVAALKKVGEIVKNPKYVNAGIGDVSTIATTSFQRGGLPIEKGTCQLHRQANFYAANWNKGTKVAKDGDVYAFYLPPINKKYGNVVLTGGEFVGAFTDKAETEAVQLYLASGEWATLRAKLVADAGASGWATSNKAVDASVVKSPTDQLSIKILTSSDYTAGFDASDRIPADVNLEEWKQMTQWILGRISEKEVVDGVEKSWP